MDLPDFSTFYYFTYITWRRPSCTIWFPSTGSSHCSIYEVARSRPAPPRKEVVSLFSHLLIHVWGNPVLHGGGGLLHVFTRIPMGGGGPRKMPRVMAVGARKMMISLRRGWLFIQDFQHSLHCMPCLWGCSVLTRKVASIIRGPSTMPTRRARRIASALTDRW